MSLSLLGSLAVLALIDSTSVGTLLLPVWFLLSPRLRVGRYVLFLGTIAAFYAAVGVVLFLGGRAWLGDLSTLSESTIGARVVVVVGLAMLVGSFFMGRKRPAEDTTPGRLSQWRDRAVGADAEGNESGPGAVVTLALLAGTVELATMLPYLGAIGLLATADLEVTAQLALLLAYCVVMVAPALVLLGLRTGKRRFIEPKLRRLAAWMERSSGETTAWIVGIVGFLLIRSSAAASGLADLIDGFGT